MTEADAHELMACWERRGVVQATCTADRATQRAVCARPVRVAHRVFRNVHWPDRSRAGETCRSARKSADGRQSDSTINNRRLTPRNEGVGPARTRQGKEVHDL